MRGGTHTSRQSVLILFLLYSSLPQVLYLNGWVIWHAAASFHREVKRTSRLLLMDTLAEVREIPPCALFDIHDIK